MTVEGARPPRQPLVSVALCTFEGERYLPELLESIEDQRRQPDEMIACDDGSRDRTMEILERFRERVRFPVEIRVNEERLGSTKNFEKAIALCRRDVIFLCDQDDVWHREKIERTLGGFTDGVGAVFTDAELIDERSVPLGRGLWETIGFTGRTRRRFSRAPIEVLARANVVTGATTAFGARFRDLVIPIPDGWVQDAWIALLISAVSAARILPAPLVRYRLHGSQQIGVRGRRAAWRYARGMLLAGSASKDERRALGREAVLFRAALQRLREKADAYPPRPGTVERLEEKVSHLERRAAMPATAWRGASVATELLRGRYHRYSNGIPTAVKDLLLLDSRAGSGAETAAPRAH